MKTVEEYYDVVVVGAGHAGCEAALAAARLGCETIIFTVSMNSVALMPCNPNIGGSSKGHLVKEIDALGGEMGKNIDKTYIQSKMLNKSKGPAVHSLRAQADKDAYSMTMRYTLQNTDNLTLRQAEVTELIVEDGVIKGVKTFSGAIYHAKTVVLATGTYLKARCLYGEVVNYTGPNGLQAANYLSQSLKDNGVELYRFKTGTPARIDKRSVNFDVMEEQFGDEKIVPFSFTNKEEDIKREQISCWLTYTNEETHKIIRDNLDRSPIYAIQTMMPKLHSTNFEGMELIRPLYLIREDDIKAWRDYNDLRFIQCACKFTDTCTTCNNEENQSKRVEIKQLIAEIKKKNPYVEAHIFKSVENVNIETVIAYKKDGVKHHFLDNYDL